MSASSDIIGMKDIQPHYLSTDFSNPCITLRSKKTCTTYQIKTFFLWESNALFDHFIPNTYHIRHIFLIVLPDQLTNTPVNHDLYYCYHYNKTAAEKSTAVRKTTIFFILGDEIPSQVYKVKNG